MKKILKKITAAAAAMAVALSMAACGGSSEEENAAEWTELDQSAITAAMGMGWNLGNQLEANNNKVPDETAWGNPKISETLIKLVKDQGFKTVRIPVSYLSKIGEAPDYKIDEAWLDRIQEVVDYVVNNDMFAIIN
ncbi:MAG: glycoside hydrolase family 5 protein, partial [Oscillospiraceae bacterium]|nr:glycoside hydrolase family 5 protein [Oscillospiraceae bacterium]